MRDLPLDATSSSAEVERRRRRGRRRLRHNRHLVDALDPAQRRYLLGVACVWLAGTAFAWAWWLEPGHRTTPALLVVSSALLAVESVVLPTWFFFWVWRAKRPDPTLPVPDLRVAMVVTKAPSEPWPLVRSTLLAMLDQRYPHPYDVWLADEAPDEQTRRWCSARGVRVSTRQGVAAYHRSTWPRRTRCKEGNLAYFYDHHGYDGYDVVAQLDADHVPKRDYLRHVVTPFTDPDVGYVAAPSICDSNAATSWTARGRLHAEATLHGPMQAGHSGGCAPSCIGSHYAVRTAALQQVGGLGPELAEDFTTTLMLSSAGWQGVFAIDAEAHGAGPETLADGLVQEFQWSRSMVNVGLGCSRPYWRGLRPRAKLRLGFCLLWYPLFGALMLTSIAMPIVAIATRTPFMRVELADFAGHFAPPTLCLLLVTLRLQGLDLLRPRAARAVSWELVLFQLVRWPWALMGCLHAVAGRLAGREFQFKVTPKTRAQMTPLPFRVLAPYLVLALVAISPLLLQLDAGPAAGYHRLAILNALLYLGCAVAILVLHVREHPKQVRAAVVAKLQGNVVLTTVLGAFVVATLVPPSPVRATPGAAAASVPPWPSRVNGPLVLGTTTDALAKNSTRPWTATDLDEVNRFEQTAQAHAGVVHWFADWAHHPRPDLAQLRLVAARGSVPEISWEPWDYLVGLHEPQPRYSLRSIADGAHDELIRRWARDLKAYGGPVLLRFGHEMNGDWYPWSQRALGNRPGDFTRAWHHVHGIFTGERARNVRWVWSPVAKPLTREAWPGADQVDIVGLSGFNGGTALDWTGWRSFQALFDEPLGQLEAIAPGKPVQISEVGTVEHGGDKARWLTEMFAALQRHPNVGALLWFDLRKQADWRVATSPAAVRAFRAGIAGRPEAGRARCLLPESSPLRAPAAEAGRGTPVVAAPLTPLVSCGLPGV